MKLQDLFDVVDLHREIREGFVRVRTHPHDPQLGILNYTEKAQYDKHWNDVTRQCRGLIYDSRSGEVLARPFDKFFNLGEHAPGIFAPEAQVEVTDKMDGSLGILYYGPQGWAIATRGSFESEQAIHATDVLRDKYLAEGCWVPDSGLTYLFEIVYPENRIVLDYGDQDDLVLIGVRDIESGTTWGPRYRGLLHHSWPGPRAKTFPAGTFRQALEIADRPNAEGIVVRFMASDLRVKVKQDDYVRLHKLVTGLNERAVWEHLAEHRGTYGNLLASVPDEFHEWVTVTAEAFLDAHEALHGWAHAEYRDIVAGLPFESVDAKDRDYRAAFASWARETEHPALIFQMLDGRDISPAIWKTLKPKGETASLMNRNEDNA